MKDPIDPFDWQRMLIHDFPWLYLGEVALRTVIMFTMLLLALTVSGKREVRQLSVYETGGFASDGVPFGMVALLFAVFDVNTRCLKSVVFSSTLLSFASV